MSLLNLFRRKKETIDDPKNVEMMKSGDYVVLEDDSTAFGGIGTAIGSVGLIYSTSFTLDLGRSFKTLELKWVAGNKKGKKTNSIHANRFKKIDRIEAKKIIRQYARCQRCLSGKKLDGKCNNLVTRVVGECRSIIPDPPWEF